MRFITPSALLLLCSFALASAQSPAQTSAAISRPEALTRAHAAAATLLTLYNRETGLFHTTGWWNSANAITALTDESRLAHDGAVPPILQNTFEAAPKRFPNFLNEFYDDEGWWALAWIDAYDLTHHKQYLRASELNFDDMAAGWDDHCGGGIWWKKDRHYKNAIANELFLDVAAKLALHTHRKQRARYLDLANREWTWFHASGMINADSLVNDGLESSGPDNTCHNNGRTVWSYNQGVLLGGLASLSKAAKNPALLPAAGQIATAAITHLTDPQGILHDPCEPDCGEDGIQFKGIFARNLAQLDRAAPDPRFRQFLAANAQSLWSRARTPEDRFSTVWSGPPTSGNAGAQTSALDALNAAAATTR